MQKKRTIKCGVGAQRFTVVGINSGQALHAGRSFEAAMTKAKTKAGDNVSVFVVCAPSAVEARDAFVKHPKELVRTFRVRAGRFRRKRAR